MLVAISGSFKVHLKTRQNCVETRKYNYMYAFNNYYCHLLRAFASSFSYLNFYFNKQKKPGHIHQVEIYEIHKSSTDTQISSLCLISIESILNQIWPKPEYLII